MYFCMKTRPKLTGFKKKTIFLQFCGLPGQVFSRSHLNLIGLTLALNSDDGWIIQNGLTHII